MMTGRFRSVWRGPTFGKKVHKGMADNLTLATRYARDEIRRRISVQGSRVPPVHSPATGHAYPYRQTGDLIKSYKYMVDRANLWSAISSDLPYARYLEQGTRIMAPRPHIRRTIYGNPVISTLIGQYIVI
jgi:hypothetical protein